MATFKAQTVYSYKKGNGNSSGTRVNTLFTVQGKSESRIGGIKALFPDFQQYP